MNSRDILQQLNSFSTEEEKVEFLDKTIENIRFGWQENKIIEPVYKHLSDQVKSFWDVEIMDKQYIVYMGFTVQLPITTKIELRQKLNVSLSEVEFASDVYKFFADHINEAAKRQLISTGFAIKPLMIKLAIVSPALRYCFMTGVYSNIPIKELKQISNLFCQEGELPCLMEDIKWTTL